MMEFLTYLEHLKFSMWVLQTNAYAYILTAHTIGMGIVAGVATIINLRLLGISPTIPIRPLEKLYPLMWSGFWVNAVTGTTLMIADATTKLTNYDFYIKMVFVFSGVALIVILRKKVFRDPHIDEGPVPPNVKRLAWLSLFCWASAITAGRLLAYLGPVSGVPGLSNQ